MTDTEIKLKGLELLSSTMGKVEAERFISLMNREPFDYTLWQDRLFADISVRELSKSAMDYQKHLL